MTAAPERVLSVRELNRAILARQLLLQRKRRSPASVIEHLVGMQAQSPQSPYIGIWSRAAGFRRTALERLLVEGAVVRAIVMRQTLHLVTLRDYAIVRAAFSETGHYDKSANARRAAPGLRALAAAGPVATADAMAYLERELGLTGIWARRTWHGARVAAHLVHHHEAAMWAAGSSTRFVAIEEPEALDPTEARAELFRRYLQAFGPATRQDVRAWAMMNMPEVHRALDRLEPLVRFRDGQGRELLDVDGAPLPDPEAPAPVRFLPKWDNVLLAWVDRSRILPEAHRRAVIKVNGDVAPTFLVDGFVAGTWRVDGGRVVPEPFAKPSKAARAEVDEEAGRLEAFLAG